MAITVSAIKTICDNPDSLFCYFGWPSVGRLPDGTLAMVASGFRLKHICPFGKGVICYSRDEGKTWTRPAVIFDTPLDDRDCGITVLDEKRVLVTSFNNSIQAQRGWNRETGEHKWKTQTRRELSEAYLNLLAEQPEVEERYLGSTCRISEDGGYSFGPVFRMPVTAPHGPCVLKDGTVLYIGRRFSKDDSFDDPEKPTIQCWKMNGMKEPELLGEIANLKLDGLGLLSCEPHAIELPNGQILVHIRVQHYSAERKAFTVYQSISCDGGRTFSQPCRLLEEQGGSPPHLLMHSSGTLISAYGYRNAPYGIRVMLSRDLGKSWETDLILYQEGLNSDIGYPCTVELQDNSLLTVFYESTGNQSVIRQINWRLDKT